MFIYRQKHASLSLKSNKFKNENINETHLLPSLMYYAIALELVCCYIHSMNTPLLDYLCEPDFPVLLSLFVQSCAVTGLIIHKALLFTVACHYHTPCHRSYRSLPLNTLLFCIPHHSSRLVFV